MNNDLLPYQKRLRYASPYKINSLVRPLDSIHGGLAGMVYDLIPVLPVDGTTGELPEGGYDAVNIKYCTIWYRCEPKDMFMGEVISWRYIPVLKVVLSYDQIVGPVDVEEFDGWPTVSENTIVTQKSPKIRMQQNLRRKREYDVVLPNGDKVCVEDDGRLFNMTQNRRMTAEEYEAAYNAAA